MIYAKPGAPFVAELDRAPQSLVGTIQVGIFLEPAGTAITAYTTAGITTENTGASEASYYAVLTAPSNAPASGSKYVVKWKNGSTIVSEDLILSGLLATSPSPSGVTDGTTFGDLWAELVELTGISDARAQSRINAAYRRFARKSKAVRQTLSLGPTVSAQATYALDGGSIIDLPLVRVNGLSYEPVSPEDIRDINASRAWLSSDQDGAFAQDFDESGASVILLWPTPTLDGQDIEAVAAVIPPAMVNADEYPQLPADFHDDLVEPGGIALSIGRDDERFSERAALLAEFDQRAYECGNAVRNRVGTGAFFLPLTR